MQAARHLTKKLTLIAFAMMACSNLAFGQQKSAAQTTQELLVKLHSPKWSERAAAFEQLRGDANAMKLPGVRSALLDLLNRENHSSPSKEPDYDPAYHEEWAEYLSALDETAVGLVDWKNAGQLCILAHSPFDPDSQFAAKLVATGQSIYPCLLQMVDSPSLADRYTAVAVLIQLRAKSGQLDVAGVEKINQITLAALHDSDELVRVGAVHALASFGGADMIPALQEVAQSDPAPEVHGSSIRKAAARAIMAIQQRSTK
jgi:HEAT repeat protein